MVRLDAALVLVLAALTVALWGAANRPTPAPPWPAAVGGYAFSPARAGQDPSRGGFADVAELEADLALLATQTRRLRTYTLEGSFAAIPALAARHGIAVMPGVWLDGDAPANGARLARLYDLLRRSPGIARVVVGNETLHRGELDVAALVGYLDRARRRLQAAVSTAEPWHVWLRHPELAEHVDYVTAHVLPYWEGIAVEDAVDYVEARMRQLAAAFPGKAIVLGEVGWPSRGRPRGAARASPGAAAVFHRRFLQRAAQAGYDYFLLEAFDQPWKRALEGEVGAYWGVHDVARRPKYARNGAVVAQPAWPALAGSAVLLATVVFGLLRRDSSRLAAGGRVFLGVVAFAAGSALVWVVQSYWQPYWSARSVVVGLLLLVAVIGLTLVLLAEAHEWAEARWSARRRRGLARTGAGDRTLPKVSVHVPAYDEPPAMLCATLRALADLDYPHFEVIVVDNNTPDDRVWRPVQALCRRLGPRFRFFHVAPLRGYKAGALNYALERTAPQATIVAVIDSDYQVERGWLRDLVAGFADAEVAVVQAPQDYRDGATATFKAMCAAEYRGFFEIGMVTRNERNAIIQHGTMTLVRRSVLETIGGWAEWTITEDAELGLRILERGHRAAYVKRSYGRGLTPDTFLAYKQQRVRWAFGAVQILRGHWRELLGVAPSALSPAQRYHFVAGWLPWLADGLNLAFSVLALLWSALMVLAPRAFDPPPVAFSALPLLLFLFRGCKVVHLYRTTMAASPQAILHALLAGLALVNTVGVAVILGLLRRRAVFVRTPKLARRASVVGALTASRLETALGLALVTAAVAVGGTDPLAGPDLGLWQAMLVVLGIPCLAATSLALVGARAAPRRAGRRRAEADQALETP